MADEFTEDEIAEHEKQVDEVAGRVHEGFDIFDGAHAENNQAKRFALRDFHDSDFKADPIDAYISDGRPQHGNEVQNFEQLHGFLEHQENLARERWPDYDRLVNTYLQPHLHEIPQEKLREYLLRDDCAELAYEFAKKRQQEVLSGAPSMAEVDRMTAEEFTERLNEWTQSARSLREENEKSEPLLTRHDLRKANELKPREFERLLDLLKARGE